MEGDKRFAHLKSDPKFRRIPKGERKIKIDKRFQSMFEDKKFKVKYTVDKRGRPVSHTSTEDLKRYYEVSSDSEDSNSTEDEEDVRSGRHVKLRKSDEEGSIPVDALDIKLKSDLSVPEEIKKKLKNLNVDYARGESTLYSESSSDDEETENEISDTEDIDHKWGELDADAEQTEEATHRLAACNMDWDRIRTVDLMVLFNSFLPSGSVIKSIAIYPSEFGKERMKQEEIKGPTELVETNESEGEEAEEGSKYHMEKLRKYQLNRLKYYYAVIVCDSASTANKIYTECDGMEYESSGTKLDLRFIPDNMTFDDEPREICDKLPESNKYQPRFFTTTALQQAKVELTWDETDPNRIELSQKLANGKAADFNDTDLKSYVALSSDEEDEEMSNANQVGDENENPVDKYKALLLEIENEENEKKNGVEMEISWGVDLERKTNKLIKERQEIGQKTPFEQYVEKRKEKRKERKKKQIKVNNSDEDDNIPSDIDMDDPYFAEEFAKTKPKSSKKDLENSEQDYEKQAELELMLMNEEDKGKKHFSLKKILDQENSAKSNKKLKKKKQDIQNDVDDFQVNVEDERFAALYSSHHYNIDPTDPHFKKTKGMEKLISEKLKRRSEYAEKEEYTKRARVDKKYNVELNASVKSKK